MVTKLESFIAPLFVPGNRPDRFRKAAASGADAIIIDLEDAVAPDEKDAARATLRADFTDLPVLVRINGEGTYWYQADVAAAFGLPVAAIMFPKAEMGASLVGLAEQRRLPIVALIETVRGIAQAREIAALPGISRIAFGSLDFCADLGCDHSREALLLARSELVLSSRLAGLDAPLDGVTTSIDDINLIAADARYAANLGFGGKLAIHPGQIDAIRDGFQPTEPEIAWAKKVLGHSNAAVAVDGAMVDAPVRMRARRILALAGV